MPFNFYSAHVTLYLFRDISRGINVPPKVVSSRVRYELIKMSTLTVYKCEKDFEGNLIFFPKKVYKIDTPFTKQMFADAGIDVQEAFGLAEMREEQRRKELDDYYNAYYEKHNKEETPKALDPRPGFPSLLEPVPLDPNWTPSSWKKKPGDDDQGP